MFEEDNEGYGLHGFNAHTLDPQATNALHTELVTIIHPLAIESKRSNDYQLKVAELVNRLCRQTFQKPEGYPGLDYLFNEDLARFT